MTDKEVMEFHWNKLPIKDPRKIAQWSGYDIATIMVRHGKAIKQEAKRRKRTT